LAGQLADLSSFSVEMALEVAESRKQLVSYHGLVLLEMAMLSVSLVLVMMAIHLLGDDGDTSALSNSRFSEKIRDIGGGLFLLLSSGFRSKIVDEAK
jgi:hypothetical protein